MDDEVLAVMRDYDALIEQYPLKESLAVGWRTGVTRDLHASVLLDCDAPSLWARESFGKVLDVGCGQGALVKLLASHRTRPSLYGSTLKGMELYQGIDFMAEHIEVAERDYGDISTVNFECIDAFEFLENTKPNWDSVFANGLLAHYSPRKAWQLIERMWHACAGTLAFNWNQATSSLRPTDIINMFKMWSVENYIIRADYNPHDFTVYAYKHNV